MVFEMNHFELQIEDNFEAIKLNPRICYNYGLFHFHSKTHNFHSKTPQYRVSFATNVTLLKNTVKNGSNSQQLQFIAHIWKCVTEICPNQHNTTSPPPQGSMGVNATIRTNNYKLSKHFKMSYTITQLIKSRKSSESRVGFDWKSNKSSIGRLWRVRTRAGPSSWSSFNDRCEWSFCINRKSDLQFVPREKYANNACTIGWYRERERERVVNNTTICKTVGT